MTDSMILGEVEITRVFEQRTAAMPRESVFPDSAQHWQDNRDLLVPDFWQPDTDQVLFSMQTWVLRSGGRTILVDTGIGNNKERPYMPLFAHLDTDYLGNLARAGVRPEDVDVVVCTHVHGDHVGWNTRLVDREWVPTFPNARYVFSRADFDYWNPDNARTTRSGRRMQNVFEDSVAPVHRAGQTVLWEEQYEIDGALRLTPAPGHTPGSAVLTLRSGTDQAVFVGDMLHSPVQLAVPDCGPSFDEAPAQAADTRRRVLGWAADNTALVLPAHFPGTGAAEVRRAGTGFAVQSWAGFSPA
ncbi:glyoxylase-like metal-dependent hydrolase (beta-lactamase superfamily II) [Kutzneria viridogrisea]|uniref:Glyoxylase-like metal-dependent hydrolase (Beta-lactamase superfamily II) n=1 Tax=Kutzneria viridogrisea TaxID=47990 RepID=A0ABR6BDN8_9PSEU|nr:glyoxylase-like metal-dependent hydrolase (beta-lactamase superfamily II) [Kutzneria viridogrisea]